MGSIIIQDEITGEPVTIENPLLPEHVKLNQFLWYRGLTSTSGWNCPAVITEMNEKKQQFQVRSLDDMRDQDQWYGFDATRDHTASRQTMRLVTPKEVKEYLDRRKSRLEYNISEARGALKNAQDKLDAFNAGVAALPL